MPRWVRSQLSCAEGDEVGLALVTLPKAAGIVLPPHADAFVPALPASTMTMANRRPIPPIRCPQSSITWPEGDREVLRSRRGFLVLCSLKMAMAMKPAERLDFWGCR